MSYGASSTTSRPSLAKVFRSSTLPTGAVPWHSLQRPRMTSPGSRRTCSARGSTWSARRCASPCRWVPLPMVSRVAFASRGPSMPGKRGFLCFVELDASSLLPDGWLVEMETATGATVEVPGPPVNADTLAVRDAILSGPFDPFPSDELMENHVHPAI